MTLRPCYRATCDAPGCSAGVFFAASRTATCRSELLQLGWLILPWRVRPEVCGAPRVSYLCPEHHDVRPAGWREARERQIRRIAQEREPRPLDLSNVDPPTKHIDSARRAAMLWMLAEAIGTQLAVARAAGMTRQCVNQKIFMYEAIIARRQRSSEGWNEPWAQRLRAAGAIP